MRDLVPAPVLRGTAGVGCLRRPTSATAPPGPAQASAAAPSRRRGAAAATRVPAPAATPGPVTEWQQQQAWRAWPGRLPGPPPSAPPATGASCGSCWPRAARGPAARGPRHRRRSSGGALLAARCGPGPSCGSTLRRACRRKQGCRQARPAQRCRWPRPSASRPRPCSRCRGRSRATCTPCTPRAAGPRRPARRPTTAAGTRCATSCRGSSPWRRGPPRHLA
mmetsp:Transcript_102937/g.332107  ORF Transcript_102937/g.332107 Transcript_102937/m.332107 type:complete len:222 (-) Transcript_102937:456-1121(-)